MAMLGSSCSPCCDPCSCLPATVTLHVDGFSEGETPGTLLCPLAFSACYGTGAEAHVTEPGGNADTDNGPISKVQVTKGGSGYAKIGRVAPTVTVTGTSGSGTGATFAVTLASSKDACNVDRWSVSKVVRTGGTGYENEDTLTFAIAQGDTQEVGAQAKIAGTTYTEPTLSLSVAGGTGAVLQVSGYNKTSDSWGLGFADTWRISGVTVADGGSGYTNDSLVTVVLGEGDEARPFGVTDLRARTVFSAPEGEWTLIEYDDQFNPSGGSGLELSITLTRIPNSTNWTATAVAITSGGTGYAVGDLVLAFLDASSSEAGFEITAVDQDGAVTALSVIQGGTHQGIDTGVIESVARISQAGWRKAVNNPDGVLVTNGGIFYREDSSVPAYVSPVTVTVTQTLPSAGTGASLSAVVDNVPSSPTFGKITAVNINNGGDGYLAYEWCEANLQGATLVLPRDDRFFSGPEGFLPHPGGCVYGKGDCGRAFNVEYRGTSLPPRIVLKAICNSQQVWYVLEASENVADCSQISFTASDSFGRSASVTAGGVPVEGSCSSCSGHVLINGVQVPLTVNGPGGFFNFYGGGVGNYTLVSVDPGPTISTAPNGAPNWWRTYAVAQAVNNGCLTNWRGEPEVWINVFISVYAAYNDGPTPPGGYLPGDYDQLTVGTVRQNNPVFAPWNARFDAYEHRLLGPIRGSNCSGNQWHWLTGQNDDASVFFTANSPRPPSLSLLFKDTRPSGRGNVQCGPI